MHRLPPLRPSPAGTTNLCTADVDQYTAANATSPECRSEPAPRSGQILPKLAPDGVFGKDSRSVSPGQYIMCSCSPSFPNQQPKSKRRIEERDCLIRVETSQRPKLRVLDLPLSQQEQPHPWKQPLNMASALRSQLIHRSSTSSYLFSVCQTKGLDSCSPASRRIEYSCRSQPITSENLPDSWHWSGSESCTGPAIFPVAGPSPTRLFLSRPTFVPCYSGPGSVP